MSVPEESKQTQADCIGGYSEFVSTGTGALQQQYVYGNGATPWTLDNRRNNTTVAQLNAPTGTNRVFYETGTPASTLLDLKRTLLETHARVRIEQRPKNLAPTLSRLASEGFAAYAIASAAPVAADLDWKSLG